MNLPNATLAQLQQYANQQAAAQTQAAAAPLQQEQQTADQQNYAHGQAIQGFAKALSQLLGQIAPQVQGNYTQAANSQAAFGKGFSDAIQGKIADSSQANAQFLQQMGAPASAARPTPDVGSVAYGLGGYIPASTMAREGAAFGAAANMLPGDALLRGQQDFTSNLYAGQAADQKIQQQIAALQGKQPGIANDLLGRLQTQQTSAKRLTLQEKQDAFNQWARTQSLNQGAQRISQAQAKQSFNQWATEQGLKIRWNSLSVAQQRLALSQAKAAQASQKAAKPKYTPIQVSNFKNKAASWAQLAWEGQYNPKTKTWVSQPQTYQAALNTLVDHGIPMYLAQLALKRYWSKPGYDADVASRVSATQSGKPIVPTWVKSETGPIYARGKGAKAFAAGKANAAQDAAYTPGGAKQTAFSIAQTKYGWSGPELQALDQLISNESGWNYQAQNPSSGALGIGQALGHQLPPDYATNPVTQINWMLGYIKQRYGSPSKALAFWLGPKPAGMPQGNWY